MSHFLKGLSADKFNQKYPVGSSFKYFPIMGIPNSVDVVTRSKAWALGHGAVVVRVNGCDGDLSVEQMTPVVMNKHIDELSKPVAWTDREEISDMERYMHGYMFPIDYSHPGTDETRKVMIYSQAYIESLLAKLEAADAKINHYVAAEYSRNTFDQTADIIKRADEAERKLEAAEKIIAHKNQLIGIAKDEHQSTIERAEAAEARLLVPVKLPARYSVDCGVCEDPNGDWLSFNEVVDALQLAGYPVEGDSNDH
ncbi:Uncharacterised protein [Yersinia frederiksenii]|nr:Uncharacterised protein [Yersinia frederiksenii]CNL55705.1 Uncharacterised protein [Yersinia frederiksenii]